MDPSHPSTSGGSAIIHNQQGGALSGSQGLRSLARSLALRLPGLGFARSASEQGGGQPRLQLTLTTGSNHGSGGGSSPPGPSGSNGSSAAAAGVHSDAVAHAHPAAAGAADSSSSALEGLSPGGASEEDPLADVAASAEQHRLLHTHSIDVRRLAQTLEASLPFVLLLVLVFVFEHIAAILALSWCTLVLHCLNQAMRTQVALKSALRKRPLLGCAAVAGLHLCLLLLELRRRQLLGALLAASSVQLTQFWDLVFTVLAVDITARLGAVLAKLAVLLIARTDTAAQLRERGHLLTAFEHCWASYRGLLPAPLWYRHLRHAPMGRLLASSTSGVYALLKASNVLERLQLAGAAVQQLVARGYGGSTPSPEELVEAGGACPICQDPFRDAVKLSCGHVFCSDCIGEWFERGERTCAMCRARVGPSSRGFKSCSDGATSLLPIIF